MSIVHDAFLNNISLQMNDKTSTKFDQSSRLALMAVTISCHKSCPVQSEVQYFKWGRSAVVVDVVTPSYGCSAAKPAPANA